MSSEQSTDVDPQLRDLPGEIWMVIASEWDQRTWYGKILFPLWLIMSVFQWFAVLMFLLPLLAIGFYLQQMSEGIDSVQSVFPDVYKNE